MYWVSEQGRIVKGVSNKVLDGKSLQLSGSDFDSLLDIMNSSDEESSNFERFFTYGRPKGLETLKVRNYVGVVRTGSGAQIEILPKTSANESPESARDILIKMLVELQDSPFVEGNLAELEAHKMQLFELVLRQFLFHVAEISRKGIARTYNTHSDNCQYLRGKLKISEHLKRNVTRQDRIYCEFDEYEVNRPINRLIKTALEIVFQLAEEPLNQQLCRELLFWFESVPRSENVDRDFTLIQKDRSIQHYEPAMPLCRMILEQLNPLTKHGQRKASAMLFPMERVFESYVGAKLRTQFLTWRVMSQFSGVSLVENHDGKRLFRLRPDYILKRDGQRVIADAKWKLLNQNDRANKYGIAEADMYQLFAYSHKYLSEEATKEVILIYPKSDGFKEPLNPFWFRKNCEVLFAFPFDLVNEFLEVHQESSLFEMKHARAS